MNIRDLLLCLLITFFWGLNYVMVKVAVMGFDPLTAMLLHYCVVVILLSTFILRIPRFLYWPLFKLGMVFGVAYFGLFFYAAKELSASLAPVVLLLQTPFALICAMIFLKEPPALSSILGTIIAFIGVVFAIGPIEWNGSLFAVLLLILAAAVWGYFNMMVRRLRLQVDPLTLNGGISLVSLPVFFILVVVAEPHPIPRIIHANLWAWVSIFYMALIATIFCYSSWFKLIHKYSVAMISPFMLLTSVFGILMSRIFLREPVTLNLAIGAILALSGISLVVLPSSIRAFQQKFKKI